MSGAPPKEVQPRPRVVRRIRERITGRSEHRRRESSEREVKNATPIRVEGETGAVAEAKRTPEDQREG